MPNTDLVQTRIDELSREHGLKVTVLLSQASGATVPSGIEWTAVVTVVFGEKGKQVGNWIGVADNADTACIHAIDDAYKKAFPS